MTRDLTQALYRAAVALCGTQHAEEVVRGAITETQRASGVEAVALYLLDPDGKVLILRESAGTTPGFRERMATLSLSEARLAARVIEEQQIATVSVGDHPTFTFRSLFAEEGFRHVTAAPVDGREHTLGMLYLASREEDPLDTVEEALVQAIGGLVGIALENAALRESIIAQQDRLRALAGGILQAREEEARRIAYELHDEVGQLLASVHITVDALIQRIPEHGRTLRKLHTLLDGVEARLRQLSHELRPSILDDLGLGPAFEWLAQGMAERARLAITVDVGVGRLSSSVETTLYRVVQEALNNAVRHARARGFDVEAALGRRGDRGLGLIGMQERVEALGGELKILSAPGKGTEVSVVIPVGGVA
jgi:signal transduction histidine kinase